MNFAESGNSSLTKHFHFFVFQVKFRGYKCHYGKEVNPLPEPFRIVIRKATIYLFLYLFRMNLERAHILQCILENESSYTSYASFFHFRPRPTSFTCGM